MNLNSSAASASDSPPVLTRRTPGPLVPTTYSCFVCQGCDRVLCTSADVLTSRVPGGVDPTHAFPYALPYLLDLDEADETWCYVCSDDVTTVITVPPPPASSAAAAPSSGEGSLVVRSEDPRRMDLVRVRSTVASGLHRRLRNFAETEGSLPVADNAPRNSSSNSNHQHHTTTPPAEGGLRVEPYGRFQEGAALIERLRWSDGGGPSSPSSTTTQAGAGAAAASDPSSLISATTPNPTSSSSPPRTWFVQFEHTEVLQCPDCLTELGWFFAPRTAASFPPHHAPVGSVVADHGTFVAESVNEEEDPQQTGRRVVVAEEEESGKSAAVVGAAAAADPFCGLVLQKIKQKDSVSLQDVLEQTQRRLVTAHHHHPGGPLPSSSSLSSSAGTTGGEAPSLTMMFTAQQFSQRLESELRVRLQALRMQTNLYSDLVTRHKEQADVQRQLLESQKERITTHEERLTTMSSIIDAQRDQLKMQQKHIAYQEQLLQNQRAQIATQQQQIDVEQQLLGEQNKTIMAQLGQLRLLQVHVQNNHNNNSLSLLHARAVAGGGPQLQQQENSSSAGNAVGSPNASPPTEDDSSLL